MKVDVKDTFFVINPKSYLYGDKLVDLAKGVDDFIPPHVTCFFTGPYPELGKIKAETNNLVLTAQHLDGISPGRGMGKVLPHSLAQVGVKAVMLNHAEHPLTIGELVEAVRYAKELDFVTIICASSIEEVKLVASLQPDIVLCEPNNKIGTGTLSEEAYIKETTKAIRDINPVVKVMQAAGVSSPDDVTKLLIGGADGTGCTSGIVKADNPIQMARDMLQRAEDASLKKGEM